MRLLIASMAALAAVAFAAPSFAQDETMPAPTSSPTAKPKAGTTAASCNKIKSSSQRSACLKKVHVAKAPKKTKKTTTTPAAPKSPEMGQLQSPPPAAAANPSSGPVSVPPLPSKTI